MPYPPTHPLHAVWTTTLLATIVAVAADEPIFVDVSSRSGLDFVHDNGITDEL